MIDCAPHSGHAATAAAHRYSKDSRSTPCMWGGTLDVDTAHGACGLALTGALRVDFPHVVGRWEELLFIGARRQEDA